MNMGNVFSSFLEMFKLLLKEKYKKRVSVLYLLRNELKSSFTIKYINLYRAQFQGIDTPNLIIAVWMNLKENAN
jgi:hypothetical protein